MDLIVEHSDVWAAPIEDKPGGLANALGSLREAGADLKFIIARRTSNDPGKGVLFVTPLGGDSVAVTATFRRLYVFVVIEHSTRRLAHVNVTANPSADWTLQQLRAVVGEEGGHQYLIHDRDKIFAKRVDESIRALGLEVLRSPVAGPKANSICERVIGTIRRECLD